MIPTNKWRACLICALCSLVLGCALPPLDGRSESQAFTQAETADTTLGQALGSERDAHPGPVSYTHLDVYKRQPTG